MLRGPAGHAVRQEHHRRRDQHHHPPAELRARGRAPKSAVGNLGFLQAKGSVSGPLVADKLAVRLGALVHHPRRHADQCRSPDQDVNSQDNLGLRGQVLCTPADDDLKITLGGDYNRQNPDVLRARTMSASAPTQRAAGAQYAARSRAYRAMRRPAPTPSTALSTMIRALSAEQYFGGASLTFEWDVGPGTLTSITAWRFWDWHAARTTATSSACRSPPGRSNRRKQDQFSQELRWRPRATTGSITSPGCSSTARPSSPTTSRSKGRSGALWLLGPTQGANPALLDGLTSTAVIDYTNDSFAGFGKLTWNITDSLRLEPGIRLNYDTKSAGPMTPSSPAACRPTTRCYRAARTRSSGRNSTTSISPNSTSRGTSTSPGTSPTACSPMPTSPPPTNRAGSTSTACPPTAAGNPILDAATIDPEQVFQYEIGLKTQFWGDAPPSTSPPSGPTSTITRPPSSTMPSARRAAISPTPARCASAAPNSNSTPPPPTG